MHEGVDEGGEVAFAPGNAASETPATLSLFFSRSRKKDRQANIYQATKMDYLPYMNERITFNPDQCGGRPCIRGMRIRVKDVLDLLAAKVPEEEILEDYPYLESEDLAACIEYAAAVIDHPVLIAQ